MIKKINAGQMLGIGLAMFSMFFGAGNVIFPLAVGQYAGDKNIYAIGGLILTAALMPILGVVAMILFEGNYREFFGRLGKIPGFLLALTIISLLGPLGSTPRCIALSYTTLKTALVDMSPVCFSGLACLLIFLFTMRKNQILTLLGWVLTPILLCALLAIVVIGVFAPGEAHEVSDSTLAIFLFGFKEGYNTMDLLAAFFFSSTVYVLLKTRTTINNHVSHTIQIALGASAIGAILLAGIYVGFSYVSAFHGSHLDGVSKDELLRAITLRIAGPKAGVLVCITIALACLTTAIALVSAFTDFVQREIFKNTRYEIILLATLMITFFVSTFEFNGISAFLGPILEMSYPSLIVLTFLNLAFKFTNFKPVKVPVLATFLITLMIFGLTKTNVFSSLY